VELLIYTIKNNFKFTFTYISLNNFKNSFYIQTQNLKKKKGKENYRFKRASYMCFNFFY